MNVFGLEVGGTKTIALNGDLSGNVKSKILENTKNDPNDKKVLVDFIKSLYNKVYANSEADLISMTFPGAINSRGIVAFTPNLGGWKDYDILSLIKNTFSKDAIVENDANAQALAEKFYGKGRDYSNFIYLTIGTGIGGGIIIDDKLYRGSNGWAGELGHMVISEEGPRCGCGRNGCFEAFSSGTSIAKYASDNLTKDSSLNKLTGITGKDVFDAWYNGDQYAGEVIERTLKYTSIGLANLVNIFDPEAIIIGGGITKNNNEFIEGLKSQVKSELANYSRDLNIIRTSESLIEKAPLALAKYYLDK